MIDERSDRRAEGPVHYLLAFPSGGLGAEPPVIAPQGNNMQASLLYHPSGGLGAEPPVINSSPAGPPEGGGGQGVQPPVTR